MRIGTVSRTLAIFAGILSLTGYGLYNSQILFGSARPSVAAWLVFGFLVFLNMGSYWGMSKDWIMSLLPIASGLSCLATTIVVICKGGGFGRLAVFDWIILACALLACFVWLRFNHAEFANAIVMVAVGVGFIPIFAGLASGRVREPTPLPWIIWTTSYALGAFTVLLRWREEPKKRSRYQMIYPAGCIALHGAVVFMIVASNI